MRDVATGDGGDPGGAGLLDVLHRVARYDAAWIALRDPRTGRHVPVLEDGPTASVRAYHATDEADAEAQRFGLHRAGWPLPAHRLPVPLEETFAWGEHLLPAGFRDGLAVGLFTEEGRHVGYLSLLTGQPRSVTAVTAALLHSVNSLVAAAVEGMPALAPTAAPGTSGRAAAP